MGCTGWPKQWFGRAPECHPGHLSSSSPLRWRCCYIAPAPARAHVQGGPGKKSAVPAVTCCAASKKHKARDSVFGGSGSAGQQRAKAAAREVARPGLAGMLL
eukprot:1162042-Pelagomonas_calceolata.AAC.5